MYAYEAHTHTRVSADYNESTRFSSPKPVGVELDAKAMHWEADHVMVAALDAAHKRATEALDAVAPRLVHRLARCHIGLDPPQRQLSERDARALVEAVRALDNAAVAAVEQGDARDHLKTHGDRVLSMRACFRGSCDSEGEKSTCTR